MWLYTLDADESPKLSHSGLDAPTSLWVLRQPHDLGDQPILFLRRDGETVAILSDSILPTSVCEAIMRTEADEDIIVLLSNPPDQVRARRRAPAQGDLARLENLLDDVLLSGLDEEQSTKLQLIPLSELEKRAVEMRDEGLLTIEDFDDDDGLTPFALPPGVPQVESITSWASNRGLDSALQSQLKANEFIPYYTQQASKIHTMYHQEMLELFGVRFGEEGGFSMRDVKLFPPLVVPSPLGVIRINVDHIGGVDSGLLPYGASLQDMRIGFIHMPLEVTEAESDEEDGAESDEEDGAESDEQDGGESDELPEFLLRVIGPLSAQRQPFYLDVTDGETHFIGYRTHRSGLKVHTHCTPTEAYYLLSGLLKGEITYWGALPDPGHKSPPVCQSATSVDNTQAPAAADSSVMPGTTNAGFAQAHVEVALNEMLVKPGADKHKSDPSESKIDELCEIMANLAQDKEPEESLDSKRGLEKCIDAVQRHGEKSESGSSDAAESDASSDSLWSTEPDAGWQVI